MAHPRSSAVLLSLCAALAYDGARAFAQSGPRYALTVRATERAAQCPDADATRAAVRERLAYDPFRDDAPASIELRYARERGFRATILVRAQGRARPAVRALRSRASGCESLGSAVSLAIAIAIDPAAAARALETQASNGGPSQWTWSAGAAGSREAREGPRGQSFSAPTRSIAPRWIEARVLSTHDASARVSLRWHMSARVGAWLPAAVPSVPAGDVALSGQLVLGVGARWRPLLARIEAGAHAPASLAPDITLWNVFSSLIACGDPGSSLRLCAAAQLSLTGALQSALDVVDASTAWGFALGARLAWEPRLGRSPVALSLAAEGLGWLVAPTVRVDGRALWTRPRGTAGIDLGVVVHF